MAGVKRRPDAAHSSATPSANNTATVHNTPKGKFLPRTIIAGLIFRRTYWQ